jgi:hypothetical protein
LLRNGKRHGGKENRDGGKFEQHDDDDDDDTSETDENAFKECVSCKL